VGELLDQAIRLYRRNFLTFVGIVALVQAPMMLLQMLASLLAFGNLFDQISSATPPSDPAEIFGPGYFIGIAGTVLLGIVGFLLVQGIAAAALARTAAESYLLGRSIGVIEAYSKIGRAWWSLIGALVLAGLLGLGLLIWFLVPCIGWLTGAGMLLFFWMVMVPLIAPVIVLEKQTAWSAIRRTWDLARHRFWWVLGFMFVLILFSQLIVSGPVYLVTVLFQILSGNPMTASDPGATFTIQTVVQSLVGLIFGLIYMPLQLGGVTLLYFDLRVRTEGFDLALQTAGDDRSQEKVEVTDITAQAPRSELTKFSITWREVGYFALISLIGVGLYIILVVVLMLLSFAIIAAAGGF
jgi:hypothetical protein